MPRHPGSKPGDQIRIERAVIAISERGLLDRRGAKAELARILGVSRQYVNIVVRKIEARDSACDGNMKME